MTNRQMEILEGIAVFLFIAAMVVWGNSIGIERMTP